MPQSAPAAAVRLRPDEIKDAIDAHNRHYDQVAQGDDYKTVSRRMYDLVTDFYEIGWGRSFHFAPLRRGESLDAAVKRYEELLSDKLGLRPGMRVIDLGCGVGGPMRHIARTSGAHVTGVNINGYQIDKARRYTRREDLEHRCELIEADFLHVPRPDASFDAAYAIEATCHAPDKVSVFSEVARLLRPGAPFAVCEWCTTALHDDGRPEHRAVREGIERGNGLAPIASFDEVLEGLDRSGFDVIEARDRAEDSDPARPWYGPLSGRELSLRSLPRRPYGRVIVNAVTGLLERAGVAPRGTRDVSSMLNAGADALVRGGELGTFTPLYVVVANKRA
jgi:sterol 24-C-methyltransferase